MRSNERKYINKLVRQHRNQYFVAHSFALITPAILLGLELKISSRTFGATLYHALHICFHISSFLHGIWLPISFCIKSKRSLWFLYLANSLANPERVFLYIL